MSQIYNPISYSIIGSVSDSEVLSKKKIFDIIYPTADKKLDSIVYFFSTTFDSNIVYSDFNDHYYQPSVRRGVHLPDRHIEYIALALRDLGASEAEVTKLASNVAAYAAAACGKAALSGEALRVARNLTRRADRREAYERVSCDELPKTVTRLLTNYRQRREESEFTRAELDLADRLKAARRFVGTYERLKQKAPERASEFTADPQLKAARQFVDQHRKAAERRSKAPMIST
jgi:hypothetical protein